MTKARTLADFNTTSIPASVITGLPAGATNTPAFSAFKTSADQSLAGGGDVKVDYNSEIYDSDNCYATNRFTPTTAGKYYFQASAYVDTNGGAGTLIKGGIKIKKNGSTVAKQRTDFDTNNGRTMTQQISCVLDMNGSTDYVEVWAHAETSTGSGQLRQETDGGSHFMGFKLA
jgi:hypothetical protein